MSIPIKTLTIAQLYLEQGYADLAVSILEYLVEKEGEDSPAAKLLPEAIKERQLQKIENAARFKPQANRENESQRFDESRESRFSSGYEQDATPLFFKPFRYVRDRVKMRAMSLVERAAISALDRLSRLLERIQEKKRAIR